MRVQEGEAFALFHALVWTIIIAELGFQPVISKTDCKLLVDHIFSADQNFSECGILIYHILEIFLEFIHALKFSTFAKLGVSFSKL